MSKSKEEIKDVLYKMQMIRRFEEKAVELVMQGEIKGAVHPAIGQEAVAVGACKALRNDDYILCTHRAHNHCIAKGGKVNSMMAELLGRVDGYSHGKGGSMHIVDTEIGMLRAMGASGWRVGQVFWSEGLALGGIAWLAGGVIGLPLAYLFVRAFSQMVMPVDFVIDPVAFVVMLVAIVAIATGATIAPASRASQIRVADMLRYE